MAKQEPEARVPTSLRMRPSIAQAIKLAAVAEGITAGEWVEKNVIEAIPVPFKKAVGLKAA